MARREDNTMELSVEEKWKRSRAALSMLLGTSIKAISESYGKGGLEKVAKAWEENNKKAAKRLMEIVGRQERDLETAARIIDFTDSIYGVEGEWKEIGPKRAVKIEKSCPLAKQFPAESCTMCFTGETTMEELIENLKLTEKEIRREFVVLRHMEILKAAKKKDKIFYLLF
jgi:predicted ArsR family transcriptional regulator